VRDETWLKRVICEYLTSKGVFHQRIAQGPRSSVGIPDIIGVVPRSAGKMFAIEAKRPGRYPISCWEGCRKDSPTQYDFLRKLSAQGGLALCVDDLEEVKLYF
jgi:hypothetical protein